MKEIVRILICGTILVLTFACSSEHDTCIGDDYSIIGLYVPDYGNMHTTRISITPQSNSYNLAPKWKYGDNIHFFAFQNLSGLHTEDIGDVRIENISEDGKFCEFSFLRPNSFDDKAAYTIYGVCGKNGMILDGQAYLYSDLIRSSIANFSAPVWFEVKVGTSWPSTAICNHLGTYEILHISNKSDKSITFKWKGFETINKWYYEYAAYVPETNRIIENGTPASEKPSTYDAIITIPANDEGLLISWYLPTGVKVKDAVLVAEVDGKEVKSNPKSSSADIKVGHAYHFYAEWDGAALYLNSFVNGSFPAMDDVPNHEL